MEFSSFRAEWHALIAKRGRTKVILELAMARRDIDLFSRSPNFGDIGFHSSEQGYLLVFLNTSLDYIG